jgi:hypothetical protein
MMWVSSIALFIVGATGLLYAGFAHDERVGWISTVFYVGSYVACQVCVAVEGLARRRTERLLRLFGLSE